MVGDGTGNSWHECRSFHRWCSSRFGITQAASTPSPSAAPTPLSPDTLQMPSSTPLQSSVRSPAVEPPLSEPESWLVGAVVRVLPSQGVCSAWHAG